VGNKIILNIGIWDFKIGILRKKSVQSVKSVGNKSSHNLGIWDLKIGISTECL
jgi:hypothetical protein